MIGWYLDLSIFLVSPGVFGFGRLFLSFLFFHVNFHENRSVITDHSGNSGAESPLGDLMMLRSRYHAAHTAAFSPFLPFPTTVFLSCRIGSQTRPPHLFARRKQFSQSQPRSC